MKKKMVKRGTETLRHNYNTINDCDAQTPICNNGICSKCTANSDCTNAVPNTICNNNTGMCVQSCTSDAECTISPNFVSNTCVYPTITGCESGMCE